MSLLCSMAEIVKFCERTSFLFYLIILVEDKVFKLEVGRDIKDT